MDDKRLISEERGKNVAEENGIKFFETSAKDNINIEQAFITVCLHIKRAPVLIHIWPLAGRGYLEQTKPESRRAWRWHRQSDRTQRDQVFLLLLWLRPQILENKIISLFSINI